MINFKNEFDINIATIPSSSIFTDDVEHQILSPLSCLREYGMHWLLEFDLPLVNKKDLKVTFDENSISEEAKLKETYSEEKYGKNFKFEYLKKIIKLSDKINVKNLSAKFENGRLEIIISKMISSLKIRIE